MGLCCFFLQNFCKVWNVHGSNTVPPKIILTGGFLKATPNGKIFFAKHRMAILNGNHLLLPQKVVRYLL